MARTSSTSSTASVMLAVLMAGLVLGACSADGDDGASRDAEPSPNPTETSASSPDDATGATDAVGAIEVVERTIAVEHPDLGTLTFDAIAAGDPDAAADGRLVVLLHGFPESNEAFRDFLVPLAEAGYYAVAPNQRGYSPGARPEDVDDYAIFELVDDLDAIATELGASRYHLVGHDWGGGVAWLAAVLGPGRLASMAVLSTPHPDAMLDGYADPGGDQRERSEYIGWFTGPDFVTDVLADGRASFEATFGAGGGIPDDHVQRYSEVLGTPEALTAAVNYYRATSFFDHPRVGPVRVPTLYVFGSDDVAFSTVSADATERYVDADYRYEVIGGGSHWLPEINAEEIVPMVLDHVDQHAD